MCRIVIAVAMHSSNQPLLVERLFSAASGWQFKQLRGGLSGLTDGISLGVEVRGLRFRQLPIVSIVVPFCG